MTKRTFIVGALAAFTLVTGFSMEAGQMTLAYTAASNSTPTRVPRKIASKEPDKPRPGASKAPVCRTIRPMPRENHRENRSRPPNTRFSAGTARSGE